MLTKILTYLCCLCLSLAANASAIPGTWSTDNFFSSTTNHNNNNLWNNIRNQFKLLPDHYPRLLRNEIKTYSSNAYTMNILFNNAGPYFDYVYQETQKRGMPAEIALIPMVESGYNPFAYSRVGATGLWQMMPGTASGFGLTINWWYDGRRDIIASTKAALDYLSYLHDFFNNDWLLAIAAYDAGEGTVKAAIGHNKSIQQPTDYWSLSLPGETENYVPKLLALTAILAADDHFGVKIPQLDNKPYFSIINMQSQIDINQTAKLAGVDLSLVRQLNPGFRRWATLPDEPYQLLLPTDKAPIFKAALKEIPKSARVTWQHHAVFNGETLGGIAAHYHTTTAILKRVNNLKGNLIHRHQSLLVPLTRHGKFNKMDMDLQHGAIAEDGIPGPRRVMHRVTVRDNLWTIAAHYGVTVNELRFWNTLSYRAKLRVNEELIIWLPHRGDPRIRYDHITIKAGDTLSVIANRHHTTTKKLRTLNQLKNNTIRVRQTLTIPVKAFSTYHPRAARKHHMINHVVKPGDTLSSIAKHYQTTVQTLLLWNPKRQHALKKHLKLGSKITIYT